MKYLRKKVLLSGALAVSSLALFGGAAALAGPVPVTGGGSTWSLATGVPNLQYQGAAYGLGRYVAVSQNTLNGSDCVIYSTDGGQSWTQASGVPCATWSSVTFGNGVFVAVGTEATMYSVDGAHWTEVNTGAVVTGLPTARWLGVTYGNSKFLAVDAHGKTISSTDGITWTSAGDLPTYFDGVQNISIGADSIAFGNGTWVTVGYHGAAVSTDDGTTWTQSALAVNQWLGVAYGNGVFVASCNTYSGCKYSYSNDGGITWHDTTGATSSFGYFVTYGGGVFQTTGNTSTDGITWTDNNVLCNQIAYAGAYGSNQFVLLGTNMMATQGVGLYSSSTAGAGVTASCAGPGSGGSSLVASSSQVANSGLSTTGLAATGTNFLPVSGIALTLVGVGGLFLVVAPKRRRRA